MSSARAVPWVSETARTPIEANRKALTKALLVRSHRQSPPHRITADSRRIGALSHIEEKSVMNGDPVTAREAAERARLPGLVTGVRHHDALDQHRRPTRVRRHAAGGGCPNLTNGNNQ